MPIHRAVARATGDLEALADKWRARGARRGHIPRKAIAKVLAGRHERNARDRGSVARLVARVRDCKVTPFLSFVKLTAFS